MGAVPAGATSEIGVLREATDATELPVDRSYDELDKRVNLHIALRTAKLFLLRNRGFRKLFDWALFEISTNGAFAPSWESAGEHLPTMTNRGGSRRRIWETMGTPSMSPPIEAITEPACVPRSPARAASGSLRVTWAWANELLHLQPMPGGPLHPAESVACLRLPRSETPR
jgi:hypothetical protein